MAVQSKDGPAPALEKEIVQSLLMFFWFEFLNDQTRELRNGYLTCVMQNGKAGDNEWKRVLNDHQQKLAESIKVEMETQFGRDFCQLESFIKLKARASSLILPFHEDDDSASRASVTIQTNAST
ncbi:MAG TPA: hypothetical protein VF988_03470 [Verrucomicrobiae bacterium]